jgi:hypothetical protein
VNLFGLTEVTVQGQYFHTLLEGGDAAVLLAPHVDFARELKRMNLVQPRFLAELPNENYSDQTIEAESNDLRAALKNRKIPDEQAQEIIRSHQSERRRLSDFLDSLRDYRDKLKESEADETQAEPFAPLPAFPEFESIPGLPEEFADYLTGAEAWHNPSLKDKGAARNAWEHLLELAPGERRYKSVWAAFMLGKSWEKEEPDKAIGYYTQVRDLAKGRFVDSAGLAAASLGLEARVHLNQKRYEQAIELYLAQLAAEDGTAIESLRVVVREALQGETSALVPLAANPRTQRVVTAYLLSLWPVEDLAEKVDESEPDLNASRWLEAVEKAEVRDADSAEKLALVAYQQNQVKSAGRWIERASGSPVAEWLRAKLLLRQGKVDQAASLLSRVVSLFPLQPRNPTNEVAPESLRDTLVVGGDYGWKRRPAEQQVLGELGVLHLTRREYLRALDAFLRAGFWTDAAYVAERVLDLEELKAYVDREWPAASAQQIADEEQRYSDDQASPALLRKQIRYLLARRLTREIHGDEARDYYPDEWVGEFDALAQALQSGWDESSPAQTRAQWLFEAATMTRTNGMELLATELEPDWHLYGGNYEGTLTMASRGTNPAARFVVASSDELKRASDHHADPEARFHYRYQAAALAWEAANLMPNDSDQSAYVLWTAGTWLKSRDSQTADLFYKTLVRRNRHTILGSEADRRRWFPSLDEHGNIVPREQPPVSQDTAVAMADGGENQGPDDSDPQVADRVLLDMLDPGAGDASRGIAEPEALDPDAAAPAEYYVVRKGDSLGSILQGLHEAEMEITLDDLLSANPELDSARLKVGQKIFFPARAP